MYVSRDNPIHVLSAPCNVHILSKPSKLHVSELLISIKFPANGTLCLHPK